MELGDSRDGAKGADGASDYIAGEGGNDKVNIEENSKSQDIVSLKGITTQRDADSIRGFTGFNNAANRNGKRHDLLEFDQQTFGNYSANQEVEEASVDDIIGAFLRNEPNVSDNKFI